METIYRILCETSNIYIKITREIVLRLIIFYTQVTTRLIYIELLYLYTLLYIYKRLHSLSYNYFIILVYVIYQVVIGYGRLHRLWGNLDSGNYMLEKSVRGVYDSKNNRVRRTWLFPINKM